MRNLVESILNKDYTKANDHLHEELKIIVARKLLEAKKMLAAKMSVGEQLNVDENGNYRETGGGKVALSHEKQKRGLTEGDVVPFEGGKSTSISPKVHVGNEYVAVDHGDRISFHKNEDGKPGKMLGSLSSEGRKTFQQAHSQHSRDIGSTPDSSVGTITKERAVDYAVKDTMKEHKPDLEASSTVTKLKEEAKRAAMKSLQEKVRIRGPNEPPRPPLTTRASRFSAALSGEEKPKPKVVKEQGPSKEDSETVGRMAQRASDETKVDNIIQRDADSAKVGELSKQEVKPNPPKEMPLSKPEERPGVVPRTTLSHPKFRSVR